MSSFSSYADAAKFVAPFLPKRQYNLMLMLCGGDEGPFFRQKFIDLAELIQKRRYLGNSPEPSIAHSASLTRRLIPFAQAALRPTHCATLPRWLRMSPTMALRHHSRSLLRYAPPFAPVATRD